MKLENEFLYAEISEMGAEVIRIYDKENQCDILWEGDPKYWKRHSPVLFPNVGKTYRNTVRIGGIQYPTSQHGFARDTMFTCIKSSKDNASFMILSNEEMKEVYPYDFELHISYQLRGKELEVEWQVKNRTAETMYFTIGGHPAFRFAEAGEKKEDYFLKVPGKTELNYILVDPASGTGVPDQSYPLELEQEMYPVSEEMFEKDALIFDGQLEEVWLCRKDRTPYVGLRCKGFPNFGIWSVKDAPFVCLEPWVGRCDNVGFEGEKFVKAYQIIVA